MRQTLKSLATGLVFLTGITAATGASTATLSNIEPATISIAQSLSTWPELGAAGDQGRPTGEFTQVAVNQIIRIGPRSSVSRPDRCTVIINGNVYYSEAITEKVARSRLAAITDQYAYCRRERDRFR